MIEVTKKAPLTAEQRYRRTNRRLLLILIAAVAAAAWYGGTRQHERQCKADPTTIICQDKK